VKRPLLATLAAEAPALAREQFVADVRAGLGRPGQKTLPSKYLYDDVGSALFEAISRLPEYGLTRADERILTRAAAEIAARADGTALVAELGSGSGRKTRPVLEALARRRPVTYLPIDISAAALAHNGHQLGALEGVAWIGLERDYLGGLTEVARRRAPGELVLVLFVGSTIGNFDRPAGEAFLRDVRGTLAPGDALLLGTDLEKPPARVIPAYDDAAGITAAFNRNLLARINRELGGDFDLPAFAHEARWNAVERRIEMHLRATAPQRVRIEAAELEVSFAEDETVWTESSHKYDARELAGIARRAGFRCDAQWLDREWPFAESLLIAT
jgi:dimethylhistidine N-methyltransferase